MYGLNIDPRNPQGNPLPADLQALGVEIVRFTFKEATAGEQPAPAVINFYRQQLEALAEAGLRALILLAVETYPQPPAAEADDEGWTPYLEGFARRAAEIARALAPWRPAFQIWQAPDVSNPFPGYPPALRPALFGRLLRQSYQAIKSVDSGLTVVSGGLVSGQPAWLAQVQDSLGGELPVEAVGLHPYTKRPTPDWPAPDWGSGSVGDMITAYRQVTDRPLWLTEVGVDTLKPADQAEYLDRFYRTISDQFSASVAQLFWFCFSDGMAHPFGLVDTAGRPKPAYEAYQAVATSAQGAGATFGIAATAAAVSLERLHRFAAYLEQNIVFGTTDSALESQMMAELRGNSQRLAKVDIWRLSQELLAGSDHQLGQSEIEALAALQPAKDLYGLLRSVVLACHQKTGALTGRLGVHSRISAETDDNAATNIKAVLRPVGQMTAGNRMVLMDAVKATADESKLRAPDIFETNVYGQHRNGLVENHAWNLQRLVRAIRNRGDQSRLLFILRLDGPDDGANVNPFNANSLQKYELAIAKLIRYFETMLPTLPFKLVLGNEPDLPHERQWSDPHLDPRPFILDRYAPAMGAFMKKMARQRPDVTFVCPALSANLKHEQLAYYTRMFGQERPVNMVPALHGYAYDVAVLEPGRQNLLERQAEQLRSLGGFWRISGTELGSSDPLGSIEVLSDRARFEDAVAWILLSANHRTPPGQDNNWSFRINPEGEDPVVGRVATVVNRTKERVLRNIRERGGAGLQLVREHAAPQPAYGVDYLAHNSPSTMVAGQTNAVQVTVRNTSYRTWPADGPHPVRLGYHWYTPEGEPVSGSLWPDNRTPLPHDLPPGESVTLNASLGPPRVPGDYQLRWDMVEELRTWFAWQNVPTLDVSITVKPEDSPPPSQPPSTELQLSASHNNQSQGVDNLQQAIDTNPFTRWSSRQPQQPGMWFQIDLGQPRQVSHLRLMNEPSPRDYPRGYVVRVSLDGQQWSTVAERPVNDQPLDVSFEPRQLRYIRIEQTGRDSVYWWSIHDIELSGEVGLSGRASHNNVQVGADNVAQAFDGRPETRWSSWAVQRPGMWFEIDLHQIRAVSGLALDTAGSPNDYPRGYVVRLSTDRNQWQEVARRDQNNGALAETFASRPARYIRVEQTGRSDTWWWSIHEVTVDSADFTPPLSGRASHNNVQTGADNVAQAFDGRPETRWSSRALQRPGMWFEIDLNQTRQVSGLALDTAGSPNDYPRGYVVRLSTDRNQWQEVARRDQNDRALDVSFNPQSARYIRVEQTGQSDNWWWSIHRVTVKQ